MQVDALHLAGCEVTFEDVGSGADNSRKGLTDVLTRCAAGDALAASELDRLGPLDARSGRAGGEAEGQRRRGLKVLTGEGSSILEIRHSAGGRRRSRLFKTPDSSYEDRRRSSHSRS